MNNMRCSKNRELVLVNEGFGYCFHDKYYYAWRLSGTKSDYIWTNDWIEIDETIHVCLRMSFAFRSQKDVLRFIEDCIENQRLINKRSL